MVSYMETVIRITMSFGTATELILLLVGGQQPTRWQGQMKSTMEFAIDAATAFGMAMQSVLILACR